MDGDHALASARISDGERSTKAPVVVGTVAPQGEPPAAGTRADQGHAPVIDARYSTGPSPAATTVVFMHIPKAAGLTLRSVLRRQYGPEELISVYAPRMEDTFREIAAMDDRRKRRARALIGHVRFGVHELLPNPCRYVTILRDPVRRVISDYRYIRRTFGHPLHVIVNTMSLAEFVTNGVTSGAQNGQVKYLSQTQWPSEGLTVGEQDLRRAQANLSEHFIVAGLTERFDASLWLIARKLGWRKPPFYVPANVGGMPPEIDADTLRAIRRENELDLELYDWARQRFEAALRDAGWRCRVGAAAFPAMNRCYRWWRGARMKRSTARLTSGYNDDDP